MRPIERGDPPTDAAGAPLVFGDYPDARSELFARLGRYCTFCERPIKAGLAVEHVHHKDGYPHLRRVWTNFLLACVNCNSTKGTKKVGGFLFMPDRDNTFRCLTYLGNGRVQAAVGLSPPDKAKATQLIRLVGLEREPTHDPEAKDLRWNDRREAWDKAIRYKTMWDAGMIPVERITDMCLADGHWSIWMTVFAGNRAVRLALIAAAVGTAACFDADGDPTPRTGGQV
jgi:uncharacterized protein (TIGR02646 family)